jgi:hypothetical protein
VRERIGRNAIQHPPEEGVVHEIVTAVSLPVPKRYNAARLTEVPTRWNASCQIRWDLELARRLVDGDDREQQVPGDRRRKSH